MNNLNENDVDEERKSADDSDMQPSIGGANSQSPESACLTDSLISILRYMESVKDKHCVCANGNNQETLCSSHMKNLFKIRDLVTSLISKMEETSAVSKDNLPIKALMSATNGETLGSRGAFFDASGEEFIERKTSSMENGKHLNVSARFTEGNMQILLNNEKSLIEIDDDFVAEVRIENWNLLDETFDFEDAKRVLLSQLRIVEVLLNQKTPSSNSGHKLLLESIEDILKQVADNRKNGIACVKFLEIANRLRQNETWTDNHLLQELKRNEFLPDAVKEQAVFLLEEDQKLLNKKTLLKRLGMHLEDEPERLIESFWNMLTKHTEQHRSVLLASAPSSLQDFIENVSHKRLMMITENDVRLFAKLRETFTEDNKYAEGHNDFEGEWMQEDDSIEIGQDNQTILLTKEIQLSLCKSLQELIQELTEMMEDSYSKHVCNEEVSEMNWLKRQYNFIYRLMNYCSQDGNFRYRLKTLIAPSKDTNSCQGTRQNNIDQTRRANPPEIADELYVWYCLIDDILAHVLAENFPEQLKECILQWYLDLIQVKHQDKLEAVRAASHNIIPLILKIVPLVWSTPNSDSSENRQIIQKQMAIFCFEKHLNRLSSRELIDEFSQFWQFKREIIDQLALIMPISDVTLLQKQLVDIVLQALEKNVETESLLAFLRIYVSFVIDFNKVPLDWYIKSIGGFDMQSMINLKQIELVENELADTKDKSYRVVDPKKFQFFCRGLVDDGQLPKHYVVEILNQVLSTAISQLQRTSWTSARMLSEIDQVSSACEYLSTIQYFLPFLRNQTAYVSFKVFFEEKNKSTVSVIKGSTSRQDFSARCRAIKNLLIFEQKKHEISDDKLLEQFKVLNPIDDVQLLRQLYLEYCEHFEALIYIMLGKSYSTRAAIIADRVKKFICDSQLNHFSEWDTSFKQKKVPQIIAGLAAVWSILESNKTGCFVSPHFGQILCIFKLLSVDKPTVGIDAQLAQLAPREGKSLVLAMLAAFFALMGYDVRIVCYNSYLAQRDRQNFSVFYGALGVISKVSFILMEDESIRSKKTLSYLVSGAEPVEINEVASSGFKSITLLDDVELFNQCICDQSIYKFRVEGLDEIQVFIWESISKGCLETKVLMDEVWKFTQSQQFSRAKEFELFLNNEKKIMSGSLTKSFNIKDLMSKHLHLMINCAIEVLQKPSSTWNSYTLCFFGSICYDGARSASYYYRIFNYFRLQKGSFIPRVMVFECDTYNYGYLDLRHTLFSNCYSLALGVSGTSDDQVIYNFLYDAELQGSVISAVFSPSKVLPGKNEHHSHSECDAWMEKIFSQTSEMIAQNRAVVIFFLNDADLNKFKSTHGEKFERLKVLTENTDDKETIINEAGIAEIVTLVTAGMGVGVHFRSSELVELSGGLHVIQTFSEKRFANYCFRRRVAEKGGKGSFNILSYDY